ncbi:MAG: hypothetical protein K2X39_10090, partial [Silvanigrellaceae bacterium]|nr:hypothetical protein [Silvanigrellaceae bacterium]
SLYIPHVEELKASNFDLDNQVFLIGGISLAEQQDSSQDVYLIRENIATLSFITCKQSSTINNHQLHDFTKKLSV